MRAVPSFNDYEYTPGKSKNFQAYILEQILVAAQPRREKRAVLHKTNLLAFAQVLTHECGVQDDDLALFVDQPALCDPKALQQLEQKQGVLLAKLVTNHADDLFAWACNKVKAQLTERLHEWAEQTGKRPAIIETLNAHNNDKEPLEQFITRFSPLLDEMLFKEQGKPSARRGTHAGDELSEKEENRLNGYLQDMVLRTIHKAFVQEQQLLHGVRTVTFDGTEELYRGVAAGDKITRKSLEEGFAKSHMPIDETGGVKWFDWRIKTPWWNASRFSLAKNSEAVSTTADFVTALRYSQVNKKRGDNVGWVFIIRPASGEEAVSLTHYNAYGSSLKELTFDSVPTESVVCALQIQKIGKGRHRILDIVDNPYYAESNLGRGYHRNKSTRNTLTLDTASLHDFVSNHKENQDPQQRSVLTREPSVGEHLTNGAGRKYSYFMVREKSGDVVNNQRVRMKNFLNQGGKRSYTIECFQEKPDGQDVSVGSLPINSGSEAWYTERFQKSAYTGKSADKRRYQNTRDFLQHYTSDDLIQARALRRVEQQRQHHSENDLIADDTTINTEFNIAKTPLSAAPEPRSILRDGWKRLTNFARSFVGRITSIFSKDKPYAPLNDFAEEYDPFLSSIEEEETQKKQRTALAQELPPVSQQYNSVGERPSTDTATPAVVSPVRPAPIQQISDVYGNDDRVSQPNPHNPLQDVANYLYAKGKVPPGYVEFKEISRTRDKNGIEHITYADPYNRGANKQIHYYCHPNGSLEVKYGNQANALVPVNKQTANTVTGLELYTVTNGHHASKPAASVGSGRSVLRKEIELLRSVSKEPEQQSRRWEQSLQRQERNQSRGIV